MPKSSKKRKEKSADFTKQRLKLGKKQIPTNVVDTSFKARTIVLPTQSIAVEKNNGTPMTRRRLTIDDLLLHLKHHNVTTRKDAILGLRELLESHWALLELHLASLLSGLVRLISDEDAGVRKTLVSFLSWLLPRISSEMFVPYSSLLLLYMTAAQTHIFPEIRIDAIRVLNILLECIPDIVTAGFCQVNGGHGSRVLDGYLGILAAGRRDNESKGRVQATSTASIVLSPASKLVVLQSLSSFLRAGLSSLYASGSGQPPDAPEASQSWFFSQAFGTVEFYGTFNSLLRPAAQGYNSNTRLWCSEEQFDEGFVHHPSTMEVIAAESWTLDDLSEDRRGFGPLLTVDSLDYDYLARLARNLQPVLVSTFLDCAPVVFSPSERPSETSLQLLLAVSQVLQSLYGSLLRRRSAPHNDAISDLSTMLGYMAPYFPFEYQALQGLNVIFCELVALHRFAMDNSDSARRKQKSPSGHESDALSKCMASVSDYIVRLLRGEALSSVQVGRSLTPDAYVTLEPAIWFLLDSHFLGCAEQQEIFNAIIDHGLKTPSRSATKRPSIEFIARLILLDTVPWYQGNFKTGRSTHMDKKFEEWMSHLPQCLWELGATNVPMTEMILRILLRLLQRKPSLVPAGALGSKFIPYFSTNHAVRGRLPGPYTKLPLSADLRRLTLDVIVTLLATYGNYLSGTSELLVEAVDLAVTGCNEEKYWSHHKCLRLQR
ncbi:hypothetical protein APHAL10511_006317 [Amanita phalloides]|nr:hypothetical protein APHAL10511_006317 [Amanita phalloides]